jgi:hypothetical protein
MMAKPDSPAWRAAALAMWLPIAVLAWSGKAADWARA